MESGVIYYNTGISCTVRLLVSLYSLRRHYRGPVTILCEGGKIPGAICERIGSALAAEVTSWNCGVPPGPNRTFLAKTRYYCGTPYELTIALDSDTLVEGPIDELFEEVQSGEFCVARFSNWTTYVGVVAKRIAAWQRWLPEEVGPALAFGPAINCGVVGFQRGSLLCRDWMDLALPGRSGFIPDEVSCQVILHRYPHRIVDPRWNRSCKYDNPCKVSTRIIHFHGRKHCRPGLPFHGVLWVEVFKEVWSENVASVREWAPAGDEFLGRYLEEETNAGTAGLRSCRLPDGCGDR